MSETVDGPVRVSMLVRNAFTHDSRVENEARTLVGAGYRVTVVAEDAVGLPTAEERDGYRIVRVARGDARLPGLRMLDYRRRLVRALLATRPGILHAHDADALPAVATVARRLRIPFIHDAHELWVEQENRGRTGLYFALFRAYYRLVEARLLPRASAVLTVSGPIARLLERRYRLRRVELVPNYPPRDADLRPRPLGAVAPALPDDALVVLYLGAILPWRGLETLVEAMSRLRAPAHLVLLGTGGLRDDLRHLATRLGIADRVHLCDPVPAREVIGYAAGATVGVSPILPSSLNYRHSLPNKLFQYMAAGLPVVASDFPQVRDVVEGSGAGICVDTSDVVALAGAIDTLLADPQRARAAGAAGRRAVAERYHWGVAADTLRAVYRRVSASAPGGGRPAPADPTG